MAEPRARRPGERSFGVLLLALSLFLTWQSYEISGFSGLSTPGAFPMVVSLIMVLAAVIVVIKDLRNPDAGGLVLSQQLRSFSNEVTPATVIIFTGFVVAYAALLDSLGFLPASLLFLIVAIQFLHRGRLRHSVLISVLALLATYAVFRLVFKVVLPEGMVPEREILAWIEHLFTAGGR